MPRVTNNIHRVLKRWVNKNGLLPPKHPEMGPCWIWLGNRVGNDYGKLTVNYVVVRAHRYIYKELKGNLPIYMDLHHKCEVALCVNPEHLEPSDKHHRGLWQKAKEHCPKGHEYTEENTGYQIFKNSLGYIVRKARYCRMCHRESFRKYYQNARI